MAQSSASKQPIAREASKSIFQFKESLDGAVAGEPLVHANFGPNSESRRDESPPSMHPMQLAKGRDGHPNQELSLKNREAAMDLDPDPDPNPIPNTGERVLPSKEEPVVSLPVKSNNLDMDEAPVLEPRGDPGIMP